MAPTFHANCLNIEDTDVCLQVGFADREFDTSDYLMLQRAHEFDEQDRRLGTADVYIERNNQAFSMYGGIERIELMPARVRLLFDDRGSRVMCGLKEVNITFDAGAVNLPALRTALRRCFEGSDFYSETLD